MAQRMTAWRGAHDLGLAAWFGGSLMGVVGLNRAAVEETQVRTAAERVAGRGWARWTPVCAAAVAAHLAGGAVLLADNASRVRARKDVAAVAVAKAAFTGAALATTAWTRVLGRRIELAVSDDPQDAENAGRHPIDLTAARRQLTVAQWMVPALTGVVVVLNALQGEQQRPAARAGCALDQFTRLCRTSCGRR